MRGRGKYGAVKYRGYASKREHNRAEQLKLMQSQGLISELSEQVTYVLVPAQFVDTVKQLKTKTKVVPKCVEHAVKYVADFVYKDADGNIVVEDTKGFRTPDYIIKRKLMRWVHGIAIREI